MSDPFDVCKKLTGSGLGHCTQLVEQCLEQQEMLDGETRGFVKESPFVLEACGGRQFKYKNLDQCIDMTVAIAQTFGDCPLVPRQGSGISDEGAWAPPEGRGPEPIDHTNAADRVKGAGNAIVIVADPGDPALKEFEGELRKANSGIALFLIDKTKPGSSYAALCLKLGVDGKEAAAVVQGQELVEYHFVDGALVGRVRLVHGMEGIDHRTAGALVGAAGDAVVLVADPDDSRLESYADALRESNPDSAIFFLGNDKPGSAYVSLAMKLGLDKNDAHRILNGKSAAGYLFKSGAPPSPIALDDIIKHRRETEDEKDLGLKEWLRRSIILGGLEVDKKEFEDSKRSASDAREFGKEKVEWKLQKERSEEELKELMESRGGPEPSQPLVARRLTTDNYAAEWKDPMLLFVTNAIRDLMFRINVSTTKAPRTVMSDGHVKWGHKGVIDWADSRGRALAQRLGLPPLSPTTEYTSWIIRGEIKNGFLNGVAYEVDKIPFDPGKIIERSGGIPDGHGFVYIGKETRNLDFGPKGGDAIVVVGDPEHPESDALIAQLAQEREALGGRRRHIWIVHSPAHDASELLSKIGISRSAEEKGLGIYHISKSKADDSSRATPYRPFGFVTVARKEEADHYILNTEERVLLVIGAAEEFGVRETAALMSALAVEQHNGFLVWEGGGVGKLVYVNEVHIPHIFRDDPKNENELIDLFKKDSSRPQAYLFSGKGAFRKALKMGVADLPGGVKPVELATAPGASVGIEKRSTKQVDLLWGAEDWSFYVNEMREDLISWDAEDWLWYSFASPMVFIYGDEKKNEGIYAWKKAAGEARMWNKEDAPLHFIDTGKGGGHGLSKRFRKADGKPLGESGMLKCEVSKEDLIWTCYPYQPPAGDSKK